MDAAATAPRAVVRPRRFAAKRVLQLVSLALVLIAAAVLLLLPTYSSYASETSGDGSSGGGSTTVVETTQTMLQVVGPWLLVLLAVPLAAALLPVFAHGRAWTVLSIVSAVVLWMFVVVGALTIGMFFAPSLVLSIVAACLPRRPRG